MKVYDVKYEKTSPTGQLDAPSASLKEGFPIASWTDGPTDRWTDGTMDGGRTDTPSYRDAGTHLKKYGITFNHVDMLTRKKLIYH